MNSFLLTVGLSVVLINAHQLIFGADFKGIVGYWSGMPFSIMDVFISKDRASPSPGGPGRGRVLVVHDLHPHGTGHPGRVPGRDRRTDRGHRPQRDPVADHVPVLRPGGHGRRQLLFMYPSYPSVGLEPLYMAWFVVILAGLGNVLGAVMGAFMVALLKVLTVEYIGSGWDFVVPSALIIVILIFKPSGIFGSEVRGVLDK
jgi:branched-chain amino acid transport system permease protein